MEGTSSDLHLQVYTADLNKLAYASSCNLSVSSFPWLQFVCFFYSLLHNVFVFCSSLAVDCICMWGLLIRVCFRTVTQLITGRQCDHTPRWHALCMNKINLSWCLRSIENTSALLPRSLFSLSLPPLRHLLFCCCKVGCCDQANAAVCQFQLRPPLNCAEFSQGRNRGGNIPTVNHLRFFIFFSA